MSREETFVVGFSRWRIVLLGLGLIACAMVFLILAGFFLLIGLGHLPVLGEAALVLLALGLVMLSAYLLLLLVVLAVRIEVGPQSVRLRLPRTRGPLPLIGMIHADLTYDAIASVERREEVYVSFGIVTVQMAYSLVTCDGCRLLLGVMSRNWGTALPLDKAAEKIAAHVGRSIVDHGAVRVGGIIRAMVRDLPPWNTAAMPIKEQNHWEWRGALTVQLLMVLLGFVVLLRACAK
jgi:hypothetical protein